MPSLCDISPPPFIYMYGTDSDADAGHSLYLSIYLSIYLPSGQVGHWEEKAREAGSQLTQGTVLTKHLCAELKELTKAKAVAEKHESVGIRQLWTLEGDVAALEGSLAALGFSEDAEQGLHTRAEQLQVRYSSGVCFIFAPTPSLSALLLTPIPPLALCLCCLLFTSLTLLHRHTGPHGAPARQHGEVGGTTGGPARLRLLHTRERL